MSAHRHPPCRVCHRLSSSPLGPDRGPGDRVGPVSDPSGRVQRAAARCRRPPLLGTTSTPTTTRCRRTSIWSSRWQIPLCGTTRSQGAPLRRRRHARSVGRRPGELTLVHVTRGDQTVQLGSGDSCAPLAFPDVVWRSPPSSAHRASLRATVNAGPVRLARKRSRFMAERERAATPPYGGVFSARSQVMDAEDLRRAVTRIAHEIVERNHGLEGVVLIGLQTGGVPLARRLAEALSRIEGTDVAAGQHRRRPLPRRHRPAPGDPRGGDRHPLRPHRAAPWCWSTTCSSPGARCGPRSTPSTPTAGPGPCSWR